MELPTGSVTRNQEQKVAQSSSTRPLIVMPTSVNGHAGKPYSFRQRQATDYLALNNGPAAEDDDDGATHGTRTGASVTARGVGHASLISNGLRFGAGGACGEGAA